MQTENPAATVTAGATAGWGELFAGKNAISSLTLVGGVALHAINVFIATTILPTVVADIGGMDYYAWNTALFVTASILGSALVPKLLSQAAPRNAYLVAAIIFAIGTLACGFAPSMPAMLGGRVVQGLGGGMLLALSYAMIRIVFSERLWPRAIALVSGMWGVATLVGPAVGGIGAQPSGRWCQ
jgi:MFS family permease